MTIAIARQQDQLDELTQAKSAAPPHPFLCSGLPLLAVCAWLGYSVWLYVEGRALGLELLIASSACLCAIMTYRFERRMWHLDPSEEHMSDAMMLNWHRAAYYRHKTKGASRKLTYALVTAERLLRPVACLFDVASRPRRQRGSLILTNNHDWYSMADINSREAPPKYGKRASWSELLAVRRELKVLSACCCGGLGSAQFRELADECARALRAVEALEERQQVHWAMVKHILESLGIISLHAIGYVEQDPSSKSLCRSVCFLCLYMLRTGSLLLLDCWAQQCHAMGAGILVNDVPEIPFLKAYDAYDGHSNALSGSV